MNCLHFKKDFKRTIKRGLKIELLENTIELLAAGESLAENQKDQICLVIG